MTIEETLTEYLTDRGLSEKLAGTILAKALESPVFEPLADRMDHDVAEYPPQILVNAYIGLGTIAAEWLVGNKPKHWARPMFGVS